MDSIEFWQMQANRVGIKTSHTTYCVRLTFVNIGATPNNNADGFVRRTVREWATMTNPVNHFFIAPFGSAMTLPVFQELDVHRKIALAPSAASPALYQCANNSVSPQPECATKAATAKRFDKAFGLQPPASRSALPFLAISQLAGAKTVAFYAEETTFSLSLVRGAREELSTYGMKEIELGLVLPPAPNVTDWTNAMTALREANPDIIVGGTSGAVSCKGMLAQFSIQGWLPKAALFSLCATDPRASVNYPNSKYFVDYMEWDRRLTGSEYVDHLYFPPTNISSSPMQMAQAFTTNFTQWGGSIESTPVMFGVCFGAGVVVRSYFAQ